jgi:oxazoline/thiazoline synthase
MGFEEKLVALGDPRGGILEFERVDAVPNTRLHVALGSVRMPAEVRADRGTRLWAGGKGASAEAARRVLILEAAERYSALFDGAEDLLLGTVSGMAAFPVDELLQFSEAQYAGEARGLKRLSAEDEILWVKGRSLADGREAAIPAGYVYLDYLFEGEPFYYSADTSGCAAGESYESAITSAVLEAIERDALALWWYNQAERPELWFEGGEPENVEEARTALRENDRSLHLLDLTSDLGVAVVAATSADSSGGAIYLGAAADADLARAASRATDEMLQFLHWDRVTGHVPRSRHSWIREGSYARFPFLLPNTRATAEGREGVVPRDALAVHGLTGYAVDLTRPALEVPVVRVIVPGLRHYGRRFSRGRLYEVPVRMGWLPRPRDEAELNAYAVPL